MNERERDPGDERQKKRAERIFIAGFQLPPEAWNKHDEQKEVTSMIFNLPFYTYSFFSSCSLFHLISRWLIIQHEKKEYNPWDVHGGLRMRPLKWFS